MRWISLKQAFVYSNIYQEYNRSKTIILFKYFFIFLCILCTRANFVIDLCAVKFAHK
jgi:hypothetical protein